MTWITNLLLKELSKTITTIAPWKAPGSDGITADFLQHCKSCLLPLLHDILVKCWRARMVPQDMHDAKIIILFKTRVQTEARQEFC